MIELADNKRRNKVKKTLVILTFGMGMLFSQDAPSQEIWTGKDGNIRNVETRAMIVDGGAAYLATRSELYRTSDISQGDKWEGVFSLPPGENEITALSARGKNILLGTKRGLFKSEDGGGKWDNVFRTIIPDKSNVLSIDISHYNPRKVIISTMKGVFISDNFGSSWQDISANLKNKLIKSAALNKDFMYAAGDDGLYIRRPGQDAWERIYVNNTAGSNADNYENTDSADPQEATESEESPSAVNCVKIKGSKIYIGANKNVLYSDDEGKSWHALPKNGLSGVINYILPLKNSDGLYCATTKGAFEFNDKKEGWSELYKGIDKACSVSSLLACGDDEKTLWAVTEKGIYKMEAGRYVADQYMDVEKSLKSFKILADNEPTFKDIQQAAIKFCDVSPKKIQSWQRDSRLRSLVPKVSVGFDNHRSSNQEIYTSANTNYVSVGPDDFYKAVDVSVSWDVSQLIWSDSQPNIDVRSRLNTQLRNDILDDLRRAYYERKRLQIELIMSPPKDPRSRIDRELRLQELTQSIDDLTGNYLSEHMKTEPKS